VLLKVRAEPVGAERPQDDGDLLRLVATVQGLDVREPLGRSWREPLLAKLTRVVQDPSAIRGGWGARGERLAENAP
jgi:hypothetical protein